MTRARFCKLCGYATGRKLIPLCASCKIAGAWGSGLTFAIGAIIKGLLFLLGLQ